MSRSHPRGSAWHRWDPHLHAPGTLLNDQFAGNWEAYLAAIEMSEPRVRALGVTDYYGIRTYREVGRWKASGRLPDVALIFPNVEIRLDVKTDRSGAVNLHLVFSPDAPRHDEEIERVLGRLDLEFRGRRYRCTPSDLTALGKAYQPDGGNDETALRIGAQQFKVDLQQLRDVYRSDAWMRENCLIAVPGGVDGPSGLRTDSFDVLRREIESFADIIFSGSPSDREFWLGKKAGFDAHTVESAFGGLKPCLHGSDAHDRGHVAMPDGGRFCWIKGDLTFEALRQAVIEPEERVWIGTLPPPRAAPSVAIQDVRTTATPWLTAPSIPLNTGLVGVIGARGSGKTALLDLIASGAHALGESVGDSSFLKRATTPVDHIGEGSVALVWGDGTTTGGSLSIRPRWDEVPQVCYLSQQFVERLCSAAGLATELRQEMERVVFQATDPQHRLDTESFDELAGVWLAPIRQRREELQQYIQAASDLIVQQEALYARLPALRKDLATLTAQIERARKDLEQLLPKGREEHARRLAELEQACNAAAGRVEALERRQKRLQDLRDEVAHVRAVSEPARWADLRRRYGDVQLSPPDWEAFRMTFAGDVNAVLERMLSDAGRAITTAVRGGVPMEVPAAPPQDATATALPLEALRARRDLAKREVGIDVEKQRRYDQLATTIAAQEAAARRAATDIANAEGADERRKQAIEERRANYSRVFDTFVEEEQILRRLYAPLEARLSGASGALGKLDFIVNRRIAVDEWTRAGEELLDLRNATRFRGHGALKDAAVTWLLPAWQSGAAAQVASAMEAFLSEHREDLLRAKPSSLTPEESRVWTQQLATWLFSTAHVRIEYGIRYEKVPIEQLSPGTRGIVLLLLYLVIDQEDLRPLVVDQPEENLDPNSVFAELVPQFREARKRRQVIVVTHNANLVVNTDAEQVIVASATRGPEGGLPTISYRSGSLENPEIRRSVCEILEGGERAFLERERRYRLQSARRGRGSA